MMAPDEEDDDDEDDVVVCELPLVPVLPVSVLPVPPLVLLLLLLQIVVPALQLRNVLQAADPQAMQPVGNAPQPADEEGP
jgi:hypothetical protein